MTKKDERSPETIEHHESIIQEDCCICLTSGPSCPHHMDKIASTGKRKKDDYRHFTLLPFCLVHHTEYHAWPLAKFEDRYKVNVWKLLAIRLAKMVYDLIFIKPLTR